MNIIECFTLTLEREVKPAKIDCRLPEEYQCNESKEPPIIIKVTNLITDVATVFPIEQTTEEIVKYLCDEMMKRVTEIEENKSLDTSLSESLSEI